MKTYRIFLASSFELRPERIEFGNFILQENKRFNKQKVNFELGVWEDMDDSISTTCKQDDYNSYLKKCDICLVKFWTKIRNLMNYSDGCSMLWHTIHYSLNFAKNMNKLKVRNEKLEDFVIRLEENGLFLGKRSFKVITDYTGVVSKKDAITDDILNILYDFSKLNEEERYWLVNIAILPATNYEFIFLCKLFKQDEYKFLTLETLAG